MALAHINLRSTGSTLMISLPKRLNSNFCVFFVTDFIVIFSNAPPSNPSTMALILESSGNGVQPTSHYEYFNATETSETVLAVARVVSSSYGIVPNNFSIWKQSILCRTHSCDHSIIGNMTFRLVDNQGNTILLQPGDEWSATVNFVKN